MYKSNNKSLPWKVLTFANSILITAFCTSPLERNKSVHPHKYQTKYILFET